MLRNAPSNLNQFFWENSVSRFPILKNIKITIRQLYCRQERQSPTFCISCVKWKKKLLLRVKVFMLFQCCAFYPKICSYFVWCSMLHNDAGKLRRNIDKTFFLFLCARSPLGCVVSLYQWLISAISGLKEVPEFLLRTFSKYLAFTPGKILFRVSMTSCDAAIFLSLKKITSVSIYYAMNERSYIFS